MKRVLSLLLSAGLLLSSLTGCGNSPGRSEGTLHVAATTYPVYLLASAVAEGVEGIEIETVINQSVACVHDYTLTIGDMKALERADVILLSGAGLEDFLDDAIGNKPTFDCSVGVELLCTDEDHDHDHHHHDEDDDEEDHHHEEEDYDPHIWMDPERAAIMAENIAGALAELSPENREELLAKGEQEAEALRAFAHDCREELSELSCRELITFHEGFAYFADAFDLEILAAVEEEAGSEASAKQIVEMVHLIEAYQVPVIFTEENGSDATAKAIVRECGVGLSSLTMMMSGPDYSPENNYQSYLKRNIKVIKEALQ